MFRLLNPISYQVIQIKYNNYDKKSGKNLKLVFVHLLDLLSVLFLDLLLNESPENIEKPTLTLDVPLVFLVGFLSRFSLL